MNAVDKDWLESRPKGTVIKVTHPSGHDFQLMAEAGVFRDFILHSGTPAHPLHGLLSRHGVVRRYWSPDLLADWVADGLCAIELMGDSK